MKIMVFTGGYLPAQKYGGPVTSLVNFVSHLGDEFEIEVVARNHDLHEKQPFSDIKPGFNKVGKAQVLYLADKEINYKIFKSIIEERKPDCLYLSSIFDYALNLPLLIISKQKKIPVIYAPRGELNPNVLAIKSFKKKVFLFAMRLIRIYKGIYFQATSEQEKACVCKELKVNSNMVFVLPNMAASACERGYIKKENGVMSVVSISRIHKSKNLLYALECISSLKGKVLFDIYGPVEDSDYWQKCLDFIKQIPTNITVNYKGTVRVGESVKTFSEYHCFLFPTISENYSQAIAESVLAGTPIVISKSTTPWDDVDKNGGFAIELDNQNGFIETLQQICNMNNQDYNELCDKLQEYRKRKLSSEDLCLNYKDMFNSVINNKMEDK